MIQQEPQQGTGVSTPDIALRALPFFTALTLCLVSGRMAGWLRQHHPDYP